MALTEDEEFELLSLERERAMASSSRTDNKKGIIGKTWDALSVPEKMSREGLEKMAGVIPEFEPTGNMVRDIAFNTPRILANTVAEAAPSFISPESIVTAGTLKAGKFAKPLIKAGGRGIAKVAEGISGLEYKTPGVLTEAAKDATLMWGKGTKKAGKLFDELADKGRIRKTFARATSPKDLLDEALNAADDGSLTPEEALVARRTLDKIKKTLPDYSFRQMRETFDSIAKTKSAQADKAFSRAVKADALRTPFATNKSGGTSIAKGFLGTLAGGVPNALMSPFLQALVASGVGLGARGAGKLASVPRAGTTIGALLNLANRRYANTREE